MKICNVIVLAMVCVSCTGHDDSNQLPANQYPNPAPAGIWDPHQPQPYPDFELPEGCEHNLNNLWQARCNDIQLDLGVLSKPYSPIKARDWRDQRYALVNCQNQGEKDLWINCARGFQKQQLQYEGRDIYILQYFGDAGDLDELVTELFWDGSDWAEGLVIQGDFEKATPTWESLIATLQYHYRIPAESFQK